MADWSRTETETRALARALEVAPHPSADSAAAAASGDQNRAELSQQLNIQDEIVRPPGRPLCARAPRARLTHPHSPRQNGLLHSKPDNKELLELLRISERSVAKLQRRLTARPLAEALADLLDGPELASGGAARGLAKLLLKRERKWSDLLEKGGRPGKDRSSRSSRHSSYSSKRSSGAPPPPEPPDEPVHGEVRPQEPEHSRPASAASVFGADVVVQQLAAAGFALLSAEAAVARVADDPAKLVRVVDWLATAEGGSGGFGPDGLPFSQLVTELQALLGLEDLEV